MVTYSRRTSGDFTRRKPTVVMRCTAVNRLQAKDGVYGPSVVANQQPFIPILSVVAMAANIAIELVLVPVAILTE